MQWKVLTIVLTGLSVLCATSCVSSRQATTESLEFRVESVESVDSSRVKSIVVRDTLREVTTVTVVLRQAQEPSQPVDTIRVTTVTDRTRVSDRSQLRVESSKIIVEHDTLYVMKRDSVLVEQNTGTGLVNAPERKSRLVATLRWIFWILVALIVLILCLKIKVIKY